MPEPTDLARRLAAYMKDREFNQRSLAIEAKLNETAVRDILIGRSRSPRYATLAALAGVLRCSVAELTGEAPPADARAAPAELADAMPVPAPNQFPRDVEVLGVAVGGPAGNGDFSFNGTVIDHVRRPPGLSGASGVFAIYVVGDSMSPRFEAGELLFIDEARQPAIGDDVVVELYGADGQPGACYIKRLQRRSGSVVTLLQFNPPADDIKVPADQVRRIYRVMTAAELFGV